MRPDPTGDPSSFLDDRSIPEFQAPGPLLFLPLLFIQGGGMDLSKVGEKIISSVRSARSLGLLPSSSDRPELHWLPSSRGSHKRLLRNILIKKEDLVESSVIEHLILYASSGVAYVLSALLGLSGLLLGGEISRFFYMTWLC
ncbi:hypothetical protein B296_00055157 [Ensete ventricosum]|uniref:Uncharacterized protein n=1 Tax=Ensete ventricosum TaxID=4639 RepID=A0A426Y1A3_ENSVE|nr:hypothetical protein B296_00055157 [Ensete ventricosum]